MKTRRCLSWFALVGCFLVCRPGEPAEPTERTLCEWTFNRDGDLQGWQPNGHMTAVSVSARGLVCRTAGADPILDLRTPLDFPATPWQALEVTLKADRDGAAEWFWSNTDQGRFGGFSQDKTTRFPVVGDKQSRTYRVFPFWHAERKIMRLRFDLYDGASFAIERIRVVALAMPAPAATAEFDFTRAPCTWRPVGDATVSASAAGLAIATTQAQQFALAPPVTLTAEERSCLALQMSVDHGTHATVYFAAEQKPGLQSLGFPITADGKEHLYNVEMLAAAGWRGRIIALGLRPSNAPASRANVRWLRVVREPQGPPQLEVVSFALEDALPRAGVPATLTANVANQGGQVATKVRAAVTLPAGVHLVEPEAAVAPPVKLAFGEQTTLTWKIVAAEPLSDTAVLRLTADHAEPVAVQTPLAFTPRPALPRSDYVPEPKPVRGPYEVGAYYFPGWKAWSQWQPIQNFPERRPVLGWYREGDPEVADWQIKWAVEHGITFFVYDWYWSQGARHLEHGLHDGYFKARYRKLLKFCLLWANHNPPGTSSPEDCIAVTRYWIENYFRRPEHLQIDGKPVVVIFSTERLTSDLGHAKVKPAFEAMRAECRAAGLKGLYLVACVFSAGQARQAAEEGYDALTAYNWPSLGMETGQNRGPFDKLVEGYRRNWDHLLEQSPIPLLLPLSGGWDSRPWHGENHLIRHDRTPALFERHLQDARKLLDARPANPKLLPLVLVEAWNEWGEGSYIEPHKQFGFGYVDAIRKTFTDARAEHTDLAPADVGLGPYDLPRIDACRTAWEFRDGDQGWSNTMQMTDVRAANGVLTGRTTGNDPALFGPPVQARAGEFSAVAVRMKLEPGGGQPFRDSAQLFWSTSRLSESEASSVHFAVSGDGQWHDYRLPAGQNPRWRGVITRLRLDPCNRADVQVALEYVRLEP